MFKHWKKTFRWVSTWWTGFWPKITVLTQNDLKLIFYPGRHGWARIDSVDSVLTKYDGFDPKRPETHFFSGWHGLTRVDSVDSVLTENDGFDPKRPETHFLPWSTWFDPYWLGGLGFDRKLIFYLGRHGLTCIDPVESVLMERFGWLEQNISFFLILNFLLIFLDFYK